MVIIRKVTNLCLVAMTFFASSAFAERLNWLYLDVTYQQPNGDNTKGFSAEFSSDIAENWVLQSRVSRLRLSESDFDLEMSQTRFDLSVGRVFSLSDKISALVSAGYTRLEFETEFGSFEDNAGEDAGNVQLGLRARINRKVELEASVGVLFDDQSTSNALWNAGLRYRAIPSLSVLMRVSGIDNELFDSDDLLYEIGFRFDLREPERESNSPRY